MMSILPVACSYLEVAIRVKILHKTKKIFFFLYKPNQDINNNCFQAPLHMQLSFKLALKHFYPEK